jgi:hypothetical protein
MLTFGLGGSLEPLRHGVLRHEAWSSTDRTCAHGRNSNGVMVIANDAASATGGGSAAIAILDHGGLALAAGSTTFRRLIPLVLRVVVLCTNLATPLARAVLGIANQSTITRHTFGALRIGDRFHPFGFAELDRLERFQASAASTCGASAIGVLESQGLSTG